MPKPTPHGNKLRALLLNPKLPPQDVAGVQAAIARYDQWIASMTAADASGEPLLRRYVELLNQYKRSIEIDLIYDSTQDFLYRQKGQLKIDNTILEEFFPWLADHRLVPGLAHAEGMAAGPQDCFAALTYVGLPHDLVRSGVFDVHSKDQDYALSKVVHIRASEDPMFRPENSSDLVIKVAFLAAECKTNLDKTMFNEAMETARALKAVVPASRYLLVCEWLDMTPRTTANTDLSEAIILRKARRLDSNFRSTLSTHQGRQAAREVFVAHQDAHPIAVDTVGRVVAHMNEVFPEDINPDEAGVLNKGYF